MEQIFYLTGPTAMPTQERIPNVKYLMQGKIWGPWEGLNLNEQQPLEKEVSSIDGLTFCVNYFFYGIRLPIFKTFRW